MQTCSLLPTICTKNAIILKPAPNSVSLAYHPTYPFQKIYKFLADQIDGKQK